MKDRWGDEEFEVVHQVTPDMPVYEVCDRSGNASHPLKQTFPGGLHLRASHTLEPRCRTFEGDVRTIHPSGAHSLGV